MGIVFQIYVENHVFAGLRLKHIAKIKRPRIEAASKLPAYVSGAFFGVRNDEEPIHRGPGTKGSIPPNVSKGLPRWNQLISISRGNACARARA